MPATLSKAELTKMADELAVCEVLVETNEGTYGPADAMRATRTGDPRYNDYRIYETVGTDKRWVVGCDPAKAPGYARKLNRDMLVSQRAELAELRKLIKAAK